MAPDEFQQAWQSNAAHKPVTVNEDLLFKLTLIDQYRFQSKIFARDCIEICVCLLLLGFWIYQGITASMPWTWFLMIPALIWVAGFMLVDRRRHPQSPTEPGDGLQACVAQSLQQVEHQIWLLRNVFWWYLLPFTIALLAFFGQVSLTASATWSEFAVVMLCWVLFVGALYGGIYFMNQRAVRMDLEPRRHEYLEFLAGLSEETSELDTNELVTASASWLADQQLISGGRSVTKLVFVLLGITACLLMAAAVLYLAEGAQNSSQLPQRDANRVVVPPVEYDGPVRQAETYGETLAKMVVQQRQQRNLVGLAAMVMVDGNVIAAAAHGERKIRSGIPVELDDHWHLGGITKTVTSTMIARLVESGELNWALTVADVFPEADIHNDWKPVTLRQLLNHTAGAQKYFSLDVRRQNPRMGRDATTARVDAVLDVMSRPPEYPPGTKSSYSGVGVTIAGAIAEEVTGATWDNLVNSLVFEPLKLKSAGFGPPLSDRDAPEQPRGHRVMKNRKAWMTDKYDNTPIVAPANSTHMSLRDLCVFGSEHLRGYFREGTLLSTETYRMLHTPELDQRACGWVRRKPTDDLPHTVYWNNGSNTAWYAMIAFIPEKNMVVAVTSNDGDVPEAGLAAWTIVQTCTQLGQAEAEDDNARVE